MLQGSVLGLLLFLIYINDITVSLNSGVFCCADNTTLLKVVDSLDVSATNLNEDLSRIADWSKKWLLDMNASKTKSLLFSFKREVPLYLPFFLNNSEIEEVDHHVHQGSILTGRLSWKDAPKICKVIKYAKSYPIQSGKTNPYVSL